MSRPDLLSQVEDACARLAASGRPVTFTAVATNAAISRASLYRDPTLRALIDEHRHRAASARTLTGLADDIAALRTAIEALASRVRHHEEQIRLLQRPRTRVPAQQ